MFEFIKDLLKKYEPECPECGSKNIEKNSGEYTEFGTVGYFKPWFKESEPIHGMIRKYYYYKKCNDCHNVFDNNMEYYSSPDYRKHMDEIRKRRRERLEKMKNNEI